MRIRKRREENRRAVNKRTSTMNDQGNSNTPTDDTDQNSTLAAPPQRTVAPGQVSTEANRYADGSKSTANELAREFKWFEGLSLFVNAVLAAVGILALSIYSGQLEVVRGQLKQMEGSSVQTDKLLRESEKESEAAKVSAAAAESASRTASDTLRQTKSAFAIEVRPYIVVEKREWWAGFEPVPHPVRINNFP